MKDLRVNTPFGKATVTEDMGDSVQVDLARFLLENFIH